MKSSPVSARLAALAIATMVFAGLGPAQVFASPDSTSPASKSRQANESSNDAPAISNTLGLSEAPDTAATPSVGTSPSPEVLPTPSSSPSTTPSTSAPTESTAAKSQVVSDAGAVMGQAGKNAPQPAATKSRLFSTFAAPTVGEQPSGTEGKPLGLDVSGWQPTIDWNAVRRAGAQFAYVKSSEGTEAKNNFFAQQYNGSASVGLLRGAYHFAIPNVSSGASQARVMLASGGGWSADGITLPPALDIEDNPRVATDGTNKCYGMSPAALVNWVRDFTNTIKASTGVDPVIYTGYYYWQECLGGSNAFANTNPLWIAAYYASSPWMPGQWPKHTIWQYANNYADQNQSIPATFPGDQNVFNGTYADLLKLATTGPLSPQQQIQIAAASNPSVGSPTSGIYCTLVRGGCYQAFVNGAILWNSVTGAQMSTFGPIRDHWGESGYEAGSLGYPTSSKICGLRDAGCYQMFEGGAILWSQSSGAKTSAFNAIRGTYSAHGLENGRFGYPVSDEACGLKGGGCYQMFQGGAILWSPTTGAQPSYFGGIRETYRSLGFENGRLGYPVGDEYCTLRDGGCYQSYEAGSLIWAPGIGTTLSPNGSIRTVWGSLGFENGWLGYPLNSEYCTTATSCRQDFEGGSLTWTSSKGVTVSRR